MISVQEALLIIEEQVQKNPHQTKPLQELLGYILAEDVLSPIDMPPFRQSSMDGYAFTFSSETSFRLIGEVQAGISEDVKINAKEAVRIFTGARVPNDADTVVMQEHVSKQGTNITIEKFPKQFANVRNQGEQIKKGELALQKGTYLNEAAIGFLAGLGIKELSVYQKPSVGVLVTGNELQDPGKKLEAGQIYDSNSVTLRLALERFGIQKISISFVEDTLDATKKAIHSQLEEHDVVLISGGISVGDYDFVKEALAANQVQEHFYKVNQKPGKPLWFGSKEEKQVFALPGNPASSLTCFYIYVVPALRRIMGYENIHLARRKAKLSATIHNPFQKTRFLKGTVRENVATPLMGQASSMLKSFAISNVLLEVPAQVETIEARETITYIDLNS